MKPITRYERYLAYLGNDEDANGIDSPVTRIEQYLSKIAGQDVPIPERPILRIEQYLAKIAGQDVAIPDKPISRVEMYLAKIAGQDIEVPEPITREEWYLAQWAENGSGVLKTVTGTLIHITDALAKPTQKFVATLEPIQSGSGDPSPDNVRPITGHTGANVTRTGKNLFDLTVYDGGTYNPTVGTVFNLTIAPDSKQFTDNGDGTFSITTSSAWSYYTLLIPIKNFKDVQLYRKIKCTEGAWTYGYLNENFVITFASNNTSTVKELNGLMTPDTSAYFFIVLTNRSTAVTTITLIEPQIEISNSATSYVPYKGTTIPITFPSSAGTVYGGTLTINEDGSGELAVDKAVYEYDGSNDEGWANSGSYFYISNPVKVSQTVISNLFKGESPRVYTSLSEYSIAMTSSPHNYINIYCPTYNTVQEFCSYLAEHHLQIMFNTTPTTYTLTELQVITLLRGENNIWCDASDDLELTYLAEKI